MESLKHVETLFKDFYYFEFSRKEKMYPALSLLLGALTLLGSGLAYFTGNLPEYKSELHQWLFLTAFSVTAILFALALIFCVYALCRQSKYAYISSSDEITEYYNEYVKFHKLLDNYRLGSIEPSTNPSDKLSELLIEQYGEASLANRNNNNNRANHLYYAQFFAAICAITLALFVTPMFFLWR